MKYYTAQITDICRCHLAQGLLSVFAYLRSVHVHLDHLFYELLALFQLVARKYQSHNEAGITCCVPSSCCFHTQFQTSTYCSEKVMAYADKRLCVGIEFSLRGPLCIAQTSQKGNAGTTADGRPK